MLCVLAGRTAGKKSDVVQNDWAIGDRQLITTSTSKPPTCMFSHETMNRNRPEHRFDIEEPEERTHLVPPSDGGKQAWLVLAGGFVINVLIWGKS